MTTKGRFGGTEIKFDGQHINLTHMHKASGGVPHQQPAKWLAHPSTAEFVEALTSKLNLPVEEIIRSARGRFGGTFAHWLALPTTQGFLDSLCKKLNAEKSGIIRSAQWLRLPQAVEFIEALTKKSNVGPSHIIRTAKGRFDGAYAHWQIALAYAKYLSPEFHIWCNQVVKERVEEEADPGKAIDRGIQGYLKQGRSIEWVEDRVKGKGARLTPPSALLSTPSPAYP